MCDLSSGAQHLGLHKSLGEDASPAYFEHDDLDMAPFDAQGGLGKMYQLFGDKRAWVIAEMNRELVA